MRRAKGKQAECKHSKEGKNAANEKVARSIKKSISRPRFFGQSRHHLRGNIGEEELSPKRDLRGVKTSHERSGEKEPKRGASTAGRTRPANVEANRVRITLARGSIYLFEKRKRNSRGVSRIATRHGRGMRTPEGGFSRPAKRARGIKFENEH